jgi:hypothetical protein
MGLGLRLRCCLVPSGHGHVSVPALVVAEYAAVSAAPPRVGPPRLLGKQDESVQSWPVGLNSLLTPSLFSPALPSSSDLAGNEMAAAGTRVGKRDTSKISGPRQAWRSRYGLTETCIWIEQSSLRSHAGRGQPGFGTRPRNPQGNVYVCLFGPPRDDGLMRTCARPPISLLPLCLTKAPRTMLGWALVFCWLAPRFPEVTWVGWPLTVVNPSQICLARHCMSLVTYFLCAPEQPLALG